MPYLAACFYFVGYPFDFFIKIVETRHTNHVTVIRITRYLFNLLVFDIISNSNSDNYGVVSL